MADDERDERSTYPAHRPDHDISPTIGQPQAGEDVRPEPPPEDMRDFYGNAGPAIGDAAPVSAVDVPEPEAGPYGPGPRVERPHVSEQAPSVFHEPTRDPSLSRAVDRAAAGIEPDAAGYDRSIEGPPPGPLDAPADREAADAEDQPGGQWGSSG